MSEYLSTDPNAGLDDGYLSTDPNAGLEPPKKSSALRRIADVGVSLGKGVASIPELAVGLADIPTGGRVGKAAQDAGVDFKGIQRSISDLYSPEQQEANRKVQEAQGFGGTLKAAFQNPSTIVGAVAESAPLLIPGMGVARGLGGVTKLSGLARGAIGEGVTSAGLAAERTRQETDDGTLSAKQSLSAVGSGAGTALLGAAGGKVAQKLGISDIDTFLASKQVAPAIKQGFARRLAGGALAEGVFEELPQSVQEQVWQNYALGKPLDEGVAEAGAIGMLAGGAMGGAFSALNRGNVQPPSEAQPAQAQELQSASTIAAGFSPDEVDTFKAEQVNPVDEPALYDVGYGEDLNVQAHPSEIARQQFINNIAPPSYLEWAQSVDIADLIDSMPMKTSGQALTIQGILNGPFSTPVKEQAAARLWSLGQEARIPTPESLPANAGPLAKAAAAGTTTGAVQLNNWGMAVTASVAGEPIQAGEKSNFANTLKGLQNAQGQRAITQQLPESNQGGRDNQAGSDSLVRGRMGGMPDTGALEGREQPILPMGNAPVADVPGVTFEQELIETRNPPEVAQPISVSTTRFVTKTLSGEKNITAKLYELPGYVGPQLAVAKYKSPRGQGYRVYLPKSGTMLADNNGVGELEDTLRMAVQRVSNAKAKVSQNKTTPATPLLASAPALVTQQSAVDAAQQWDTENRISRVDRWFEGAHVTPEARDGFTEALNNGGSSLSAHGMAKETTLTGGIKNLLGLLTNGLDITRRNGVLDTAPLVSKAGEGMVGATASGSAYSDGPFILVARPGEQLSGNLSGLGAILINQEHADIAQQIAEAVHAIRPDIIVETYSGAGRVAQELNSQQQQTGDHLATKPSELPTQAGQAQGTEGKTEVVAVEVTPPASTKTDEVSDSADVKQDNPIKAAEIEAESRLRLLEEGTPDFLLDDEITTMFAEVAKKHGVNKTTLRKNVQWTAKKYQEQPEEVAPSYERMKSSGSYTDYAQKPPAQTTKEAQQAKVGLPMTESAANTPTLAQKAPDSSETPSDQLAAKSITRNGDNIVVIGYPREALENARTKLHANAIIDKKGQAVFRAGTDFTALQEALNPGSAYIPDAKSLKAADFPMYVSGGKFSNARAHNFAKKFGAKSFDNKPEAEAYAEALTRGEGGNWKAKKHLGKWRAVKEGVQDAQDQTKAQVPQAQANSTPPVPVQPVVETPVNERVQVRPGDSGVSDAVATATQSAPIAETAPEAQQAKPAEQQKQDILDGEKPPREAHDALFAAVRDGTATLEQYKAGFQAVLDAEDAIKTELNGMTKEAIFKAFPGIQYRYKSEKKSAGVDAAYDDMLSDFALGRGVSFSMDFTGGYASKRNAAIKAMVDGTTQEYLDDYAAKVMAARGERAERTKKNAEAAQDPKTLEGFAAFFNANVKDGMTFTELRMMLTPEQRARYDEFAGEKTRGERKARADQQKTEIRAASQSMTGEVIETKHTKTGAPLFVVKAAERVDRDVYNDWNTTAKRLGGYYSSFKGAGAVPGFQFKAREGAEAFLAYLGGNVDQAKEAVQARRDEFQDDKSQSAVERLNEMAARMEERADESMGVERKANTERRARFAASAEAAASAEKAMAKTMRNIANAIKEGKAKFLDRVRQKAQVEMLRGFVNSAQSEEQRTKYPAWVDQEKHRGEAPTGETADYAKFPSYTAYRSDLASLGRQLEQIDGAKKIGAALLKVADDVTSAYLKFAKENLSKVATFTRSDKAPAIFASKELADEAIKRSGYKGKAIVLPFKRGQNIIIQSPSAAKENGIWQGDDDKRITLTADFGSDIVEKAKSLGTRRVSMPWVFESVYDARKRLAGIGIETPAEFRSALREFIALQEQPAAPDKIKEMERAMIGRRNDGLDFFPTPASVAQEMIDAAELEEGMTVLEPSAGMAHIAERIREAGVEPDVVEMSGERRELLTEKGFNLVGSDFMDVTGEYDRIIMNPPFSNRRDIEHVRHAYKLLKPGGRLVAIMGEGSFFGSDKKATEFRDWLDSLNGTSEKLDEGTFMDPTLPVNTGANARLVVVDKPEGESPKFSRRPSFFSPLSKAIAQAKQDTMPAPQWRLWLNGNKAKLGLKDDEIQFSGINEYLELRGKDKVTKAEIADYLRGIGGKVVSVDTEGGKQPGFSITQEVRENLTEQGLPLFARTNDATQSVPYTYTKASPEDQAAIDKLNSTLQRYFGNDKHGLVPFSGRDTDVSRAFSEEIRSLFKTRVIFVQPKSGSGLFNGFQISGLDAIFVDGTSDAGFIQIAGHELWHHIETTRPDLAKWYGEQAKLYIKDLPAYRNRLNSLLQQGEEAYTDAGAESELLADFLGDSLSDPDFLQRLASSNESKFKRLITSVRMWLGNLAYKMRGLKSSRHIGDVRALQTYLAKVLDAYAAGKKIGGIATPNFQRVWHGGPNLWQPEPGFPHGRPRLDKIGTGEGAQAYGWGFYLAEEKGVADGYAGKLSDVVLSFKNKQPADEYEKAVASSVETTARTTQYAARQEAAVKAWKAIAEPLKDRLYGNSYVGLKPMAKDDLERALSLKDAAIRLGEPEVGDAGTLYQLDIPDDVLPYLLDWDKPLSQQTPEVRKALNTFINEEGALKGIEQFWEKEVTKSLPANPTGAQIYNALKKPYVARALGFKNWSTSGPSEYLASIGIVGNRYLDGQSRKDGEGTYNYVIWDQPTLDRIALLERNGEKLDAMRDADVRMSRIGDTMPMPDIRFSRSGQSSGRTQADPIWSAEPISKMDTFLYELQDKHIDTKRIIQAIQKQGKQISDKWNVYIKEALYHGRTAKKTEDFLTDEVKPAIELMAKHGISQEDMDEYLHARHAIERNRVMKERNPDREDNDGLSGMTDEDAKAILAKAKPGFKEAAKVIDSIIAKTRQELVGYGLEKQETVDSWAELYSNYVPLQREGFEDRPGTGMGFSVRGNSSKEATGSHRAVENILAHVAMQREKAIVRGEKNRVATALYGLAQQFPNSAFWKLDKPAQMTQINPDTGQVEVVAGDLADYKVPRVKYIGKDGTVKERIDQNYKGRNNVMTVRINGVDHAIIFNDQDARAMRMVESLKNLDADQLGEIVGGIGKVTRYIASMATQYNPVFGVINLIRDTQTAALNLSSTELKGKQGQVMKASMVALKGIYQDARAVRDGKHPSSPYAKLWEEFQATGGQTGYRDMFRTSNDRAEAIEKMLDPEWWQKGKFGKAITLNGILAKPEQLLFDKVGRKAFNWLSDYNLAMENAMRLGAYKVARDNGMSKDKSAFLAKNLTVNFNKKGKAATQAGALYAFFNASAQGTARIAETLHAGAKDGEFLGKTGKAIVYGGITLGAMNAIALIMAGFDDDEPPEFMRERNLIIPAPGTDKGYVSIPMPLGFHVLPNIGRVLVESAVYGKPMDRMTDLLMTMLESFNPIGTGASLAQTISPTVFDPVIAMAENKDWTGKNIYREDFNKTNPTPGFTRTKDSASAFSKGIAEAINTITGGTEFQPGRFSPTPDQIDYLIGQVTGGVGREITKVMASADSAVTGEELPMYKVPIAGRLVGTSSDNAAVRDRFYDNVRMLNMHEAEIKGRREKQEPTLDYIREHPETRYIRMATATETQVRNLQKRKRQMIEDGKRESVKLIDAQIAAKMKRLNDMVSNAKT